MSLPLSQHVRIGIPYDIRPITQQCRFILQECVHLEASEHTDRKIAQMKAAQLRDSQPIEAQSAYSELEQRTTPDKKTAFQSRTRSHPSKTWTKKVDMDSFVPYHWAEDKLSDFNLWDAGVGASAKSTECLDFRLRNDKTAIGVVVASLSTLHTWIVLYRNLTYGYKITTASSTTKQVDSSEDPTSPRDADFTSAEDIDMDEAKANVEKLLYVLVKLGVAIRQASAASRIGNADRTLHKSEKDYAPLIEHLTFLLRLHSMVSENRPDPSRVLTIDQHSPLRHEQHVLIRANVKRRHRFEYARKRQFKLGLSVGENDPGADSSPQRYISSPLPSQAAFSKTLNRHNYDKPKGEASRKSSVVPSQYSDVNSNQVSEFIPGTPLQRIVEEGSITAPPTAIALKSDYPKPPPLIPNSTVFSCPFCHLTLPITKREINRWKKHVSEDLQPYTCYLDNCSHNDRLFNTFNSWKTHVFTEHKMFRGWSCLFCCIPFSQEMELRQHISTSHKDDVDEEYLDDVLITCQVNDKPELDRCPVCSTWEESWKLEKEQNPVFEPGSSTFLDHLGNCMHAFALRALPDEISKELGGGTSTGVTGMSNQLSRSNPSVTLTISSSGEGREGLTNSVLSEVPQRPFLEAIDNWWNTIEPSSPYLPETPRIEPTTQSPDMSLSMPKTPNPGDDQGIVLRTLAPVDLNAARPPEHAEDIDVRNMSHETAIALVAQLIVAFTGINDDVPVPELVPSSDFQPTSVGAPYRTTSEENQQPLREQGAQDQDEVTDTQKIEEAARSGTARIRMARKFFSKRAPEIGIKEYIDRIQRYCPMSTAVWLATGQYISRICIYDKAVPLTKRTMHRLVLGCTRVAMKALEDLSWPQERFAAVGGVDAAALSGLELSILFLLSFDLQFFSSERLNECTVLYHGASQRAMIEAKLRELEQNPFPLWRGDNPSVTAPPSTPTPDD